METKEDGDVACMPPCCPLIAPKGVRILEAEARDTLSSNIQQSRRGKAEPGRCLGSTQGICLVGMGIYTGTYGSQLQHPGAAAGCIQPGSSPEGKR